MSRLIDWTEYLSNEFGLTTRFVEPDTGWWRRVAHSNPYGVYYYDEKLAIIRQSLWGTQKGFEVLIHEFGHHLVQSNFFGYPGDWLNCEYFVKKYWRKVDRQWLKAYKPHQRREELVVQCFAYWAMDWGDNYEVNKGFKDFLIWNGAAPPPF